MRTEVDNEEELVTAAVPGSQWPHTVSDPADARTSDDVTYTPGALDHSAPFYVAGHRGLVGSAVWRHLEAQGFENLIGATSRELDLRDRGAVEEFMAEHRPRYMVLAAAKVGGIGANSTRPVDFLSDNLRIQLNLLDAARAVDVERVLFLGSSCIYPKLAEQPLRENALLTGYLEPTNDAYAIAKIAGILHVQSVRRQYGLPWISAMPTNLYGPGDNFSPTGSHVLPAMIRRYDEAVRNGDAEIVNWGSGSPRREFLHVDDLAAACLFLMEHYDGPQHVNVGTGEDVSIKELAELVAAATGYRGATRWDDSKPDGTPRKLMDVSHLSALGWTASIDLPTGLDDAVAWYRSHRESARG
ncbi:GDP-L-fucose synthase [Kocuria sp.]|uniref:GDP-L-fucose synthase family protein n=1 Tax=Kocuria sp. TaxID=1871328 RepID=UPI0026DB4B59|nr:GDP-L-fucose synthase [Kocuria sp.]MDO4919817.1 GDP-L-fucose synthase [Kocuria sp.]